MNFSLLLSLPLLFAGLTYVAAAPQPLITQAPILMDTGLGTGGQTITLGDDLIGALRNSAEAGGDIQSIASAAASNAIDASISVFGIQPDAQETSSLSVMQYGLFLTSLESLLKPYSREGAEYTSSLISAYSAALTRVTHITSVEVDSALQPTHPALFALLATGLASLWMALA